MTGERSHLSRAHHDPGAMTVTRLARGTYRVASESMPGQSYTVHTAGGRGTCTCRGWESHHTDCKHLRAVLAREQGGTMTDDTQMTAIVTRDAPPPPIVVDALPTALLPSRADIDLMAMIAAEVVSGSGAVPDGIKTPAQAIAVMLAGWELGLRPMSALRHLFIVNGRTELETRAMVGVIKARRPDIQFAWPEYTAEAVTCLITRPGQPETRVRYTREDARASGQLAKPGPWQRYTRDMLYAAATKRACRLACPDLINAIETSMHTSAEAESLTLPDAETRIVEAGGITAEAYNEGDDGGEPVPEADARAGDTPVPTPPYASAEAAAARATAARAAARAAADAAAAAGQQPAPAAQSPRVRIRQILTERKAVMAPDDFAALLRSLAEGWPDAASSDGASIVIRRLTDDEAPQVLAALAEPR